METETNAALDSAWTSSVDAFKKGQIASEATLQAHLFCALHTRIPDVLIHCEQVIKLSNGQRKQPDMLVVRGNDVIAVLELKFVPHDYPRYEDDVEKLAQYSKHRNDFEISLDPTTGKFSDQLYRFCESCLFVFAVIGQHDAVAVRRHDVEKYAREKGLVEGFKMLSYEVGT